MHLTDLVPILQMAIGPVILISGVGLLLLSMTNRLGRAIDRARELSEELRTAVPSERPRLAAQLKIISRRGGLLRMSIILSAVSVLLAGVLILVLFLAALLRWDIPGVVIIIFSGCLVSLIASLVVFISDINLSLSALALEISSSPGES